MKKIYLIMVILPILLLTNQAKAYTYVLPTIQFNHVLPTNNPNRFILILYSKNEHGTRSALVDIENKTLMNRQSSDIQINLAQPSTLAQVFNANVSEIANQSYLLISEENGSILFNNTIAPTLISPTQQWFFYSEALNTAYFIWRSVSSENSKNANLTFISLENATFMSQLISWHVEYDPITEIDEPIIVYDTELLIYVKARIFLPFSGYYYRFSHGKGVEYLTILEEYESRFIDCRVKRLLITSSLTNQIEVINYDTNKSITKKALSWPMTALESFFTTTESIKANSLILPVYLVLMVYIIYRRKARN